MILCDLDGVLADFLGAFTTIIADQDSTCLIRSHNEFQDWDEGLSSKQVNLGWRAVEKDPTFWRHLMPLAPLSVFRRLAAYHKTIPILFVTSRGIGGRWVWRHTIDWLENMGIHEPVVLRHEGRGKKGELVPIWQPYFAIEDDPKQALSYAEAGIEVALIDWPYTAGTAHSNIRRCNIIEALSLAGVPE